MRKFTIIALACILILGAGTFAYFRGKTYHLEITQRQIDDALADRFPETKRFLLIFTITYSDPEVTLLEASDRIQVGMDVLLSIRIDGESERLGGGCTVTAGILYNRDEKAFYLDDAMIERLEIQGIPQEHLDKVTKVVSEMAEEYLEARPVYRLRAKDAKSAAAKMLLKDVEVRDQAVHITLGL